MLVQLDGPVIAAGQSLSSALDCSAGVIQRIYAPRNWTPANITFQLSFDGTNWSELADRSGNTVTAAVVPSAVVVVAEPMRKLQFLKIRSGTKSQPINQAALASFKVVIEQPDPPAE